MFRAAWNGAVLAESGRTVKVEPGAVRVYWRPDCPFCAMLRLGLRGARVPAEWVNIWDDQAAAARVRAITGGDETVPTVVIGTRAMVNPSARQVIAAVRAGQPGILPARGTPPASRLARAAGFLTRRRPRGASG
jgi:glutaredoxin-like protein